jgi:hypothetical protein
VANRRAVSGVAAPARARILIATVRATPALSAEAALRFWRR